MLEEIPESAEGWVNENFQRLAEILADYDPFYELRWIPPHSRTDPSDWSKAFCIVDTKPPNPEYVVMYAGFNEDPQKILEKLFKTNVQKNDVLAMLDAEEAAAKAFQMKKQMEKDEEAMEKMRFWLKTPLHTIQLGKGVKADTRSGRRLEP